ncbi:MAG: amidohydrolase family protein [Phycisphaerae bacterium]
MKIDAHHHFWRYSADQYAWISTEMAVLRRDFLPDDLRQPMHGAGVDGVVTVEARQSVEETRWLLELAQEYEFIKGVVGWLPLAADNIQVELERWSKHSKLKALRHVLHDEPDDAYMLGAEFNRGIQLLQKFNLAYDILIFEKHLPQTIRFVDQHPNQIFVLDHIAKPRIKDRVIEPWNKLIAQLAKRPNVFCKLSGVVTEADHRSWSSADIQPYLDTVLNVFGPSRLMFGSDWPVCLLAVSYARWVRTIHDFIAPLTVAEQDRIMGGTAVEAYGL